MRQDTLVAIVAILAGVAVVTVVIENSGQPSEQVVVNREAQLRADVELGNYDRAKLMEYPRSALPKTAPGSWITDYPTGALVSDLEGRLRFRVMVDPYGEVAHCEVIASSGVPSFDKRACGAVTANARFHPAMDANQEPVRGSYEASVLYVIDGQGEDDGPVPKAAGDRSR